MFYNYWVFYTVIYWNNHGIVSTQYIVTVNVHSLLRLYIIHIIMEKHIFQGKY